MTGRPTDTLPAAPPPAAPARTPWYRRRAVLVVAGVVAVLVVTVLTDLPTQTSRASDAAAERSVMKEVNADNAGCAYTAGEAFLIYDRDRAGTLLPSERAQSPGLLRDDQTACSFTSESIYDLSNVVVPGTVAGRQISSLVNSVTLWSTADALGAIEDIQTLLVTPDDQVARRDLARRQTALALDRREAEASLAAADRLLGTHLPPPQLPVLPGSSPPTG